MHSINGAIKQIQKARKIAIISHINCDADALCSSLALKLLISTRFEKAKIKKSIDVFTDTENISKELNFLTSKFQVNEQRYKRYDLTICLDCPTASRMGKYQSLFEAGKDTLKIDHHITGGGFANNNIVKHMSSTCEILYLELISKRNWKTLDTVYRLLYCGIITDTNNLTQNTFNSTYKIIADLTEKDLKLNLGLETIQSHFFNSSSKQKIQLFQRALQSLTFVENDHIALMKIVKQDLNETGCKQDDTLGIVDYALKIKSVQIAIIFIKQEDNSYYVSLRSAGHINVGEIAKSLGGGGHNNVAAFQSKNPLADTKQQLIALCKQSLAVSSAEDNIADLF